MSKDKRFVGKVHSAADGDACYCIKTEDGTILVEYLEREEADELVKRWNEHDALKKKAECYNDLLEACKGLANVISIDCDDYPDLGAYNQTLTKMANAKAVIKKTETI